MKNKHLFKLFSYIAAIICMVCSSCDPCRNPDPNHKKLRSAVYNNNVALAKDLIQRGVSPYDRCYGSLWHVIANNRATLFSNERATPISKEMIDYVDSLGLDVNYENSSGATALFSYHCTKEILERMLQRGADINHRQKNGHTALTSLYRHLFSDYNGLKEEEWATYCRRLDLLISHGADMNILVNGKTMLDYLQEPLDPYFSRKLALDSERYRASRQRIMEYLYSIDKRNTH